MLIAIDGNHNVGKTTLVDGLKEYYESNKNVLFIKFPTHNYIGDFARQNVDKECADVISLLFCADYYKVFNDVISHNTDKIIILDRYILTLFALQGYMKDKNYEFLYHVCEKLPFPDVQIVIRKMSVESDSAVEDSYVETLKEIPFADKMGKVHIVDNIISGSAQKNLDGFNEVVRIIDSCIKVK